MPNDPKLLSHYIQQSRPRFSSTTDMVSETLRSAILGGALSSGEALRQDSLAEAFGVSRMPVREALRLLEAEGLVEFMPNRGAIVAKSEPAEISEIFEVRLLLEPHALRRSVPRLREDDFERAEDLQSQIEEEEDVAKWGELNRQFHLSLYSGCEGRHLYDTIDAQYRATDRYVRLLLSAGKYRVHSSDEHRQLLSMCRNGDLDRAVESLEFHLTNGSRLMTELLTNNAS